MLEIKANVEKKLYNNYNDAIEIEYKVRTGNVEIFELRGYPLETFVNESFIDIVFDRIKEKVKEELKKQS